jgi:hypothetical protein
LNGAHRWQAANGAVHSSSKHFTMASERDEKVPPQALTRSRRSGLADGSMTKFDYPN